MAEARARRALPLIVKIGGSLAKTGRMAPVLSLIAAARTPVVVVPGGGPFADAIRILQQTMTFSDGVAHRMAMLAMQQMGEYMVSHEGQFESVETLDEMDRVLQERRVPVWAPLKMMSSDRHTPANWSATSDSLAGRLAEIVGTRLILIKSIDVDRDAGLDDLARRGVIDPVLPTIVARGGLSWSIFGPSDEARLRACLEGQGDS